MVKLVMQISGISGLVGLLLVSVTLGLAPWNDTAVGDGEYWNRHNFSWHYPGHSWSYHKEHNLHGPNWQNFKPGHQPPFGNHNENSTIWPSFEQTTIPTSSTTSKSEFKPLVRPVVGSAPTSQSSPNLNPQRPNPPQEMSSPAESSSISGSTPTGVSTTTPKPSIQHNSDDDYDWSQLGLEAGETVEQRFSGRVRCRKCRQKFEKNLG